MNSQIVEETKAQQHVFQLHLSSKKPIKKKKKIK